MSQEQKDQLFHLASLLLQCEHIDSQEFKEYVAHKSSLMSENDSSKYKASKTMFKEFIEEYQKNMNNIVSIPKQVGKNGPVRLYVDGVFDITHSGHMNALRRAKSLCDVLVVGVCSDEEVTKYKNKPLMNVHERAKIPRACKWVDEVIVDNCPYYPEIEDLDRMGCQYLGHGDDLIPMNGKVMYENIRGEGRLKVFKRTEGVSTTDIMGKMIKA